MRTGSRLLVAALTVAATVPVWAQGSNAVRYTEVVNRPVQRAVILPGTVESRTASMVASEVEGLVVEISANEGQRVAAQAPLVRLRTTNLELSLRAASGQLKEAQARLELSERNLERAEDLFGSGVISQGEYDDAFSESAAWQGRVDELNAEIDRIKVDLERCTIRSPFAGVVVLERTEIGQWLGVGDAVADLVSLSRIEVRVEVPESYFPSLEPGTVAAVTFESMPGLEIEGRVTAVVPRADTQSRTFPVKLRIPNDGGRIGVGMLAQVSLPLGTTHEAVLVPKDAVVTQGPRRFVYRMNGDDTVETVDVVVGRGVGSWVVVDGALRPGERVITRGNERLRPGQSVQGEPLDYELP